MGKDNGKQVILPGGETHFLDHRNWKFEKFMTLKIQTDDLQSIQAVSPSRGGRPLPVVDADRRRLPSLLPRRTAERRPRTTS